MENKQLAENINQICKRKGITVNKLSKDLNLSSGYISEMKNKDRTPSIKKVQEIADYLEVSIDYLIGRKEEQKEINVNNHQSDIHNQNIACGSVQNSIELSHLEMELMQEIKKLSKTEQIQLLAQLNKE